MFPPNVRLPPHRKKNFLVTHPPAGLLVALLHNPRGSRSRRQNRELRAKQHRDSKPQQCSLPVRAARRDAPSRGQSSAAGPVVAQVRRGSKSQYRVRYLLLPEKKIVHNPAALRELKSPVIPSERAAPGS